MTSTLFCIGCGTELTIADPLFFSCPQRQEGDDIEHILVRQLDQLILPDKSEENSFIRYRHRLHSWDRAMESDLSDQEYCEMVRAVNDRIFAIDQRSFYVTPFGEEAKLARALGLSNKIFVKNETINVSGSHKSRHIMGIALHLLCDPSLLKRFSQGLAIASCGNAGLAAATIAQAIEKPLQVFLPDWADPGVIDHLTKLGAKTIFCPRESESCGDPSYLRFLEELNEDALPFTCQGPLNGLAIEGGCTLGYELIDQLKDESISLDILVIQVGGGALGSAVSQAFQEVFEAKEISKLPKIYTTQTFGAFPLFRAYERFMKLLFPETTLFLDPFEAQISSNFSYRQSRAEKAQKLWNTPTLENAFKKALSCRSGFMWPWDETPASIASGILDDETYDWFALLKAMIRTSGLPLVTTERKLRFAHKMARKNTEILADPTGTSGLAGLLTLHECRPIQPSETAAIIFTGVEREIDCNRN